MPSERYSSRNQAKSLDICSWPAQQDRRVVQVRPFLHTQMLALDVSTSVRVWHCSISHSKSTVATLYCFCDPAKMPLHSVHLIETPCTDIPICADKLHYTDAPLSSCQNRKRRTVPMPICRHVPSCACGSVAGWRARMPDCGSYQLRLVILPGSQLQTA